MKFHIDNPTPTTTINNRQSKMTGVVDEEIETQHQKLEGRRSEWWNPVPGSVLVRNMPLYATHDNVRNYFQRYGEVIKVEFLHRKDWQYTLACKVTMRYMSAVNTIMLCQLPHVIKRKDVDVEYYRGRHNHRDVFQKGEYKLRVKKEAAWAGNQSRGDGGKRMYKLIEFEFHQFKYTSLRLMRKGQVYTGYFEMRFQTVAQRDAARAHARWLNYKTQVLK